MKSNTKLFPIMLAGFILLIQPNAFAFSLNDCIAISNQLNTSLPIQVDAETTLTNTGCRPGKEKVIIEYIHSATTSPQLFKNKQYISDLQKSTLNKWCTNPRQEKLLRVADIQYTYYSLKGKYLGDTFLKAKDCTN